MQYTLKYLIFKNSACNKTNSSVVFDYLKKLHLNPPYRKYSQSYNIKIRPVQVDFAKPGKENIVYCFHLKDHHLILRYPWKAFPRLLPEASLATLPTF